MGRHRREEGDIPTGEASCVSWLARRNEILPIIIAQALDNTPMAKSLIGTPNSK
jgi:hypothetical protein